jgi:hypothetical protein
MVDDVGVEMAIVSGSLMAYAIYSLHIMVHWFWMIYLILPYFILGYLFMLGLRTILILVIASLTTTAVSAMIG